LKGIMKVPLFEAQKEWVEPEEFPDLRSYDEIAVDLETRDPDLKKKGSGSVIGNGEVIGIAVAVPGRSFYFPIAHGSGPNMDRKKVLEWFKDTMATPSIKIFHNAMYDVCWIRQLGIKKKEIVHQDIESVFSLETDLFPCLVDMRFKGVRVDIERAHKLKQQLTAQENELLLKVKQETGIEPQIWAARSIATVFDKLGLEYDRTEKSSAPSFTKNFLQEHSNPIVQMIAKAREINKAHTTFIDTIIRYEHKGRIHAEINQIRSDQGGTVTGRFSYNNPNLQQLPARNKDLGPLIRSLFLPEEKHTWGCFDYSQQNQD
jgi:DNA polymerase I-like protein with 3'-5' exonuclease and polymerase domains